MVALTVPLLTLNAEGYHAQYQQRTSVTSARIVVSGCEVESRLQRLLISLSNFLDRFIKKPEPEVKEEEFGLGGKPVGFFMNQVKAPLEYYIESLFDEDHCDSICGDGELCEQCYNLFSVDFGDPSAGI